MIGGDGNLFTPASFRTPKETKRHLRMKGGMPKAKENGQGGAGFCFLLLIDLWLCGEIGGSQRLGYDSCCFMGRGEKRMEKWSFFVAIVNHGWTSRQAGKVAL